MNTPYFFVPLLSPIYRRGRRLFRSLAYRGNAVQCVVCDGSFGSWLPGPVVGLCPQCGSTTRQKLAAMFIDKAFPAKPSPIRTLVFAPDEGLTARLKRLPQLAITTADLSAPGVDHHWDITAIAAADDAFELILCSHVLEHVPDDRAALSELNRILAPGGTLVIQVPFARENAETDEDFSEMSDAERIRRFGQADHCRVYGQDLVDRIRAAGFAVDVQTPAAQMTEGERVRLGLWDDIMFVCTPTGAPR
ncbi:MAG: class I SAM-dependent methyltransferase [Paracoccaceae bacterium]